MLSKEKVNKTAWQKAAERGHTELLEKLWDRAKELQLNPEELRNELLLSKDEFKETGWHKAAVHLTTYSRNPKEEHQPFYMSASRLHICVQNVLDT